MLTNFCGIFTFSSNTVTIINKYLSSNRLDLIFYIPENQVLALMLCTKSCLKIHIGLIYVLVVHDFCCFTHFTVTDLIFKA